MNKEKLVQFLSDAIEEGANFSITFYGNGVSKEQAKEKAVQVMDIVNGKLDVAESDDHWEWYRVLAENFHVAVFHEESWPKKSYMEEDVVLDGMGDEKHAV